MEALELLWPEYNVFNWKNAEFLSLNVRNKFYSIREHLGQIQSND